MSLNDGKSINIKMICKIASIIMIIATVIVVVLGTAANKRRAREIAAISQRYMAERKAEKEKERIENLNVYENKVGAINIIVIGDGIGASWEPHLCLNGITPCR